MPRPRRTVPTALYGIDSAAYTPGGGCPSHAALGVRLAQNDRCLSANIRRAWGYAWPLADRPKVCEAIGIDLGAWSIVCTPGTRSLEWVIRAEIPEHEIFRAVAYTVGRGSPQEWSPSRWQESSLVVDMVGTGASARYDGITCLAREGPMEVGVMVLAPMATTSSTGLVEARGFGTIRGFGGALGTPPQRVVRLTDGIGGDPLTAWHQVSRSWSDLAANDSVDIFPRFTESERTMVPPGGTLAWEMVATYLMRLESIALTEEVPTEL